METIYIEEEIKDLFRTQKIVSLFPRARKVYCQNYREIFNRNHQSFRLQKEFPSLILAKKYGKLIHPIAQGMGEKNYYFSTILNCPFDCEYCFLQGLYRSAHYVLFVNEEDFQTAIEKILEKETAFFFCGYDADCFALENKLEMVQHFLPFFAKNPKGTFELRTKSSSIHSLEKKTPVDNVIIAFSLNPDIIIEAFEHKTPLLSSRLQAIKKVQGWGWKTALRFDPIIDHEGSFVTYRDFFTKIFQDFSGDDFHSVTLGGIRYPKVYFQNIRKKEKLSPLFASLHENKDHIMTQHREKELLRFCQETLLQWIPREKLFVYQSCSCV